MSDAMPPSDSLSKGANNQADKSPGRSRGVMRVIGFLLLVLAGLLAWYLLVFYFGWRSGQVAFEEKRQAEFVAQIDRQVSLAREDVEQGSFALALSRLEWVLDRAPEHPEAEILYQRAQAELVILLTPQILIEPTALPSPTPSPTPTLAPIENPDVELERIRQLVVDEAWEDAVPALVGFQWQFPDEHRQETDELLYVAYIGLGLQLVQGDQVELGLSHLERAEKLGDLPESVTDYRTWAEMYLQGIAFYNVNWAATTFYFRDLCLAAPFYQSSCELLQESLIAYGDQTAAALDWCPALALYEEANQHGRSPQLADKLTSAREACASATPTPTPTSPGVETIPLTSTLPLSDTFFIPPISATRSSPP